MADASYFDPVSWLTPQENATLNFSGETLAPELPVASYDFAQPTFDVATGNNNVSTSDSPLAGAANLTSAFRATGQTLLDAWGTVQQVGAQKDQMSLQRQIAAGQLSVAKANAQSATDVALANAKVEQIKAASQVRTAQQQFDASKNGGTYIPAGSQLSLGIVVAIGVALAVAFAGKGKK